MAHQLKGAAQRRFPGSADQGKREEIQNHVTAVATQREAKKTSHLNPRRRKRKANQLKVEDQEIVHISELVYLTP